MSGLPSFRITALQKRIALPTPLGAWSFDEGTGTSANDSSGHGLTLTLSGGATWVTGHNGGFALANAGSGGAMRSNWTSLTNPVTIMCWARPLDLTSGTNRPLVGVWTGTDATTSTQFALWAQRGDFNTANVLQGNVRVGGGLVAVSQSALTLNTWVHVALSYDGTTIRLYRDGVEVTTFTVTGSINTGTYTFIALPSPANAQVDDVRIFDTTLTTAQVAAFMATPVAP